MSISLDLDNQWAYFKSLGDGRWKTYPSYFDRVIPHIVDLLRSYPLKITLFIVGEDAARPENRRALEWICADGHEIANHSFAHDVTMASRANWEIENDIASAESHIERVTGQKPRGYRGPGFSVSPVTLRVLARRGYIYDCSTLPSFLNPLARSLYLARSPLLSKRERKMLAPLFGSVRDGFRPLRPYRWQMEECELVEIPVTTMPLFRTPFHFSFLLYLHGISSAAARAYFRVAIGMCRMTSTTPSLLLHPTDFIGGDDVPDLAHLPGMKTPGRGKRRFLRHAIDSLLETHDPVSLIQHARTIQDARRIVP